MVWRRTYTREEIKDLLASVEQLAREAISRGEKAMREMNADRFSTYLDFRSKIEELRAVTALTEERMAGIEEEWVRELKVEFERMDVVLSGLVIRTMKNYYSAIREDQVLPMGARELFLPELGVLEELRAKLTRPQFEPIVPPNVIEDIDATVAMVRRITERAPSLPDFSDAPAPSKPVKRLAQLGRPIR